MSIAGAWQALRVPTGQDLLFSTKAFLAVALSLLIGFSQNLENPYWSALTVYVLVAQPQTGAIRSKALFRLAGTLIGGTIAIVLASGLGSHIGVELIATIAAILLTYYAKTLDRTPAGYTWFATALTIAVIGVIHIQQPQTIFGFGVTRMGEIALGIVMIGIVDSVVFPVPSTPGFVKAMTDWRDQAGDWAAAALAPEASLDPDARWARRKGLRKLAALFGPLDAQGVQLPYDTVAVPPRGHDLRFVRMLIVHLIAHLSAANIWIEAARQRGADEEGDAAELRAWICERLAFDDEAVLEHAARGEAMRDRLRALFDQATAAPGEQAMIEATVALRLSELADYWAKLERTLHAIATGTRMTATLRAEAKQARPVRSVDFVVGALDIAPMALGLCVNAAIWYATAWTAGISAMLFSFIVCGFIIGQPGAVRSAGGALLWVAMAFAISFLYLFAVLPRVTAFPVLIAVLAAGLVPLGVLMAMTPAGLLVLANGFALLGLQNAYSADFGSSLQSLLGSLTGCLMAIGALFLCGYDRPRLRARRLARAIDRDVVDAARSRRTPDRDRLLSLSVDRIAQFFTIVDALPDDDPLQRRDMVARLRVAANLSELRRHESAFSPPSIAAIDRLREAVARQYGTGREPDRETLIVAANESYDTLLAEPTDGYKAAGLAALTGLRVAWTPDPAFEARMGGGTA